MTVVRVSQRHTVDKFSQWVQDANQIVGERVIAFEMWNSQNAPADLPRCEHCYDDVYSQSDNTGGQCPYCFGTTYKGGIRMAHFTSAIISAPNTTSLYDKNLAEYDAAQSTAQFAADIQLHDKDYVMQVDGWEVTPDGVRPKAVETWQVRGSFNDSWLKDGFDHLGSSHRVGAQLPIGLTDQSDAIRRVAFDGLDARLVSDGQPFVVYDANVPIFDWAERNGHRIRYVWEVAEITVGDYANYRVGFFEY